MTLLVRRELGRDRSCGDLGGMIHDSEWQVSLLLVEGKRGEGCCVGAVGAFAVFLLDVV